MMSSKALPLLLLAVLPLACPAQESQQTCSGLLRRGDFAMAIRLGLGAGGYEGLMCAGRAQLAIEDYTGASKTYAELEKIAVEPFQQMVANAFRARAAKGLGDTQGALAFYERGLDLARSLKQSQAIMTSLNESGQVLQSRGDLKSALERYREAYHHAANDNERSECHHLIAFAYSALADHDKAIEHQLKSVMLEERSGDLDHYLAARMGLAEVSIRAKDMARAQREIEESLPIAQVNDNAYWEARVLMISARLEQVRGNSERYRAVLEQARIAAEQSGDPKLLKEVGNMSGMVGP